MFARSVGLFKVFILLRLVANKLPKAPFVANLLQIYCQPLSVCNGGRSLTVAKVQQSVENQTKLCNCMVVIGEV